MYAKKKGLLRARSFILTTTGLSSHRVQFEAFGGLVPIDGLAVSNVVASAIGKLRCHTR
jgi:hypothetical protein